MKKAYKTKALQYHPDRNPNGLETFKKINTAYEALTAHYKRHGGVDKRSYMDDVGGGGDGGLSRGFSGRNWRSTGGGGGSYRPPASTPLFTEEELFGRMGSDNYGIFSGGGGGDSTRGAYSSRTNGGGFRQSKQPPRPAAPTTSEVNDATNEAWRNAHGGRAPQSGYNAFKTEAESGAFRSQMRHFEEMEKMKQSMGMGGSSSGGGPSSAPAGAGNTSSSSVPRFGRRSPSKFDGSTSAGVGAVPTDGGGTSSAGSSSSRTLPRQGSASSILRARKEAAAAASSSASASAGASSDPFPTYSASQNNIESQRELEAEWASERERQARLQRAQEAMEATERRLRREQREAETRMEWERTQVEMELERTDRAAEERVREINKQREEDEANGTVHYVDASVRATAKARRKEREDVLSRLLPTAPLLEKMTIQELYILRELSTAFQSRLSAMTDARIRDQSVCLVCHATKKDPRTVPKFSCGHCCVCMTCSLTCALCPICGADRTDM